MEELLRTGADPDVRAGKGDGQSPLHWAAMRGEVTIARVLLDHGASVNLRDCFRSLTPLHLAVAHARARDTGVATVELLLDRGAELDAQDCEGYTPLHSTLRSFNASMADLLLKRGADVNLPNNEGCAALMLLRSPFLHLHIAELLLQHGARIEARNHAGKTPLMIAAAHGEFELCRWLLDAGADVDAQDPEGRTPLQFAVAPPPTGSSDAVWLSLHAKANSPELDAPILERRERLVVMLRTATESEVKQ